MASKKITIPKNEGRCADAVLRILENREKATRYDLAFPEQFSHPAPVELVCRIGKYQFAIEHTRLQSFPQQIADELNFANLFDKVIDNVAGDIPKTGYFELFTKIKSHVSIPKRRLSGIENAVTDWVRETAATLNPINGMDAKSTLLPGVPFEVTLICSQNDSSLNGQLRRARLFDHIAIENDRDFATTQSLEAKLPKLAEWKKVGAISVLVLEEWDRALSNIRLVASSVRRIIAGVAEPPDEIYCVDTKLETEWTVWTLKRGGVWEPPKGKSIEHAEFDPRTLQDVT